MTMITHGIQGAKRQTRHEASPRSLLMEILEKNPGVELDICVSMFLVEMEKPKNQKFQTAINEYWATHNYHALVSPRRQAAPAAARERAAAVEAAKQDVAAVVQRQAQIILLDMPMPNGKALRDCTGKECSKAGGWLSKIAGRIWPTDIVGKVLSEDDVRKLWR